MRGVILSNFHGFFTVFYAMHGKRDELSESKNPRFALLWSLRQWNMGKRILCIGDNHLPFLNKSAFTWITDEIIPSFKPHLVIDQGDKYDQFAQKKFPGKMIDPQSEFLEARQMAEEMWGLIRKRAPRAKCFQLRGNHDARAYKRLMEKAPELLPFFNDQPAYQFDGVETIHDPADELVIDDILFTHGHKTKLEPHLNDFQFMYNVVIGHLHTSDIIHRRVGALKGKLRWAACAGTICDPFAGPLMYRPMKRFFDWTAGVLLIEDGWPKFVGFHGKTPK